LGIILLAIVFFIPNGLVGKVIEKQHNFRINRKRVKITAFNRSMKGAEV